MKKQNPAAFSDHYQVRQLTQEDIPAVLRLMQGNTLYFQYCGGDVVPSEASIRRDMSIVPTGKTLEDKYYHRRLSRGRYCLRGIFYDECIAAGNR